MKKAGLYAGLRKYSDCHPERSEGSRCCAEMLHSVQHNRFTPSPFCNASDITKKAESSSYRAKENRLIGLVAAPSGLTAGPWMIVASLMIALLLAACGSMADQPYYRPDKPPYLNMPADSVPVQGREIPLPTAVVLPAPTEVAGLKNPIQSTDKTKQEGRTLYLNNCSPCHGQSGKGDGPVGQKFLPRPADLTSPRVQGQTDGEIFWKVTEGISTMPPTKGRLTDIERWTVVTYLKSLDK